MAERNELAELASDVARHLRWARSRGETAVPAVAVPAGVPAPAARSSLPAPAPAAAPAASRAPAGAPAPPSPAGAPAVAAVAPPRHPAAAPASPAIAPPASTAPAPLAAAPADPSARLAAIRADLGPCTRCKLGGGRKNLVFGVGNPRAELVFVGEGPGAEEDEQGLPFVGKAGQLLTRMIEAMGYARDQVYICNVVKCRPPGNRNPEPDEIAACEPYLRAQLEAIRPGAIVALGKFAAQTLLRDPTPITRLRGKWRTYAGIPLMPTFHPAYLLRSPEEKKKAWEDLKLVLEQFGRKPPARG